jgi:hypothetical protein
MFVLCPHCHFLVATDPASGNPPLRCARCHGLLVAEAEVPPEPESEPQPEPEVEAAAQAPAADATQPATLPGAAGDGDSVSAANVADTAEALSPSTSGIDEVAVVEAGDADVVPATLPDPVATPDPAPTPARPRARKPRKKTRAPARASAPTPEPAPDPVVPGERPAAPGFVHRQRARIARSSHTQRWMIAAIALLSLLLVLQLLLADRANLARDARWRPAMSALCGALHCTLPAWREPAAFTLLDRDVRPRPGMPGVLRVTATFRNDARWPQPWPALLLTLSDLDGRAAGARVFTPREYLGAVPTQATLASGQSAMLSMDVMEPGPRIVAFTFDFR